MGDAAEILDRLCRNSKTLPVFEGAERAERDLDPRCVVPPDVRIEDLDELINGRGPPVSRIGVMTPGMIAVMAPV